MVKREIARYEQFLISHSVFKRLVMQTSKNQGLFGKGLNTETLYQAIPSFNNLEKDAF